MTYHQAWIGGKGQGAREGAWYAWRGPGPKGMDLGLWPRCGRLDGEAAWKALKEAGPMVVRFLRRAGQDLAQDPDPYGESAAAYDLSEEDFAEYVRPLREVLEELLGDPPQRESKQGLSRLSGEPIILRVPVSYTHLTLPTIYSV